MRQVEPYQCKQLDDAHAITINPNASDLQQAWAVGWITTFWTSHAGLAAGSAMLAWAYVPASVSVPVVSQIAKHPQIATGVAGGISGMVGNIGGQLINNGFNISCINSTNTLIAGIVGTGTGALAPGITSMPQAVMLGGNSNTLQYFLTQLANGDSISPLDILLSYGTGAFAGRVGGPYVAPTQHELHNPLISAASLKSFYYYQANLHLKPILLSNFGRNILSAIFTNVNLADTEFFQSEDDCESLETPVEQRATPESEQHITQGQILQRTAEVNVCTN
jgi:hypothetical protein